MNGGASTRCRVSAAPRVFGPLPQVAGFSSGALEFCRTDTRMFVRELVQSPYRGQWLRVAEITHYNCSGRFLRM
ncbi:hypothetical protein BQ8794_500004 [Mesorhizobium prunaredense]|uniref:Uncharacterized protein n=1 Tax=Mesorhizobium prunaredense TaxID=1631249 RepID=A0A1R3VFQ0_9HYPH|nr:hypothetical protein BQ8794_500004 [Mesorhizobium prunaredense]